MSEPTRATEPGGSVGGAVSAARVGGLVLLFLACLVPFVDKAFHVDDPLFLWAARHIQSHPVDFFGFQVNWTGIETPMADVTRNPPGAAYFIALAALVGGWSEAWLHVAFLAPAVAAVAGTYVLAARLGAAPAFATLAGLLTPAFLVSSTSVMCDMPLVAAWVWATVFWIRGLDRASPGRLMIGGLLMGLAALTKYFGVSLVPLLLLYAVARRIPVRVWALPLLVPVAIIGAYQLASTALYGHGLVGEAARYATGTRALFGADGLAQLLMTLTFAGGSLATVFLVAPVLWAPRALAAWAAVGALAVLGAPHLGTVAATPLSDATGVRWLLVVQLGLFATAGVHLIALALRDLARRRSADALLLALWVLGTLVFTGGLNWTVNVRSILPMAPAVGILAGRALAARGAVPRRVLALAAIPVALGAILALVVTDADYRLANSARTAARVIGDRVAARGAQALWFQGHWGFQYYMEQVGGRPIDVTRSRLEPGDLVALPMNNTATFRMPDRLAAPHGEIRLPLPRSVATIARQIGAGFYSDLWGPLPFAFGPAPEGLYYVVRMERAFQFDARSVVYRARGVDRQQAGGGESWGPAGGR